MPPYLGLTAVLRRTARERYTPWLLSSHRLLRSAYSFFLKLTPIGNDLLAWCKEAVRRRASTAPEIVADNLGAPPIDIPLQPRLNFFQSLGPHGFHRVAYTEWGDPANTKVVVCMHGFTRNSRDFDSLAARLAGNFRVVCMDAVGRGASDWLEHKEDYDFSLYLSDAAALLARVLSSIDNTDATLPNGVVRVDWIGTSMGGLMGMMLAAKPNTLVRRLVLNDVGPLVPWSGLLRLHMLHSRRHARFANLDQIETYLREVCGSFGPLTDAHWKHIARHSASQLRDGSYVLAYDPAIMNTMRHARRGIDFEIDYAAGVDLWSIWDRVKCPTLVLRGASSDMLLRSTSEEMRRRGPKARIVEFVGIGHAPWLVAEDQISAVREFLEDPMTPSVP